MQEVRGNGPSRAIIGTDAGSVKCSPRNASAAKSFYAELFGWKTSGMPMGPGNVYTIFRNGGKDAGGLMQIRPGMGEMPSHWLSYVLVKSVYDAIRKAGKLGARIHVPGMDIPGIGRIGIFEDPTGAELAPELAPELALFQPAAPAAKAKPAKREKRAVRKTQQKGRRR